MYLANADIEKFTEWLGEQGAEFKELTNPYEVLRFKLNSKLHILYKRRTGALTVTPELEKLINQCRSGAVLKKPAKPQQKAQKAPASNGWARDIVKRGQGLKALLLRAVTGPQSVPDCGCNALPWECCACSALGWT